MALEIVPLVGDLLLFPGDLILLGGDLLLFDADAVLHLGDLALEDADLALEHRDFLFQLRLEGLGSSFLLFGVVQLRLMLLDGRRDLVQLVLQRAHAGGRTGRVDRHAQHEAGGG